MSSHLVFRKYFVIHRSDGKISGGAFFVRRVLGNNLNMRKYLNYEPFFNSYKTGSFIKRLLTPRVDIVTHGFLLSSRVGQVMGMTEQVFFFLTHNTPLYYSLDSYIKKPHLAVGLNSIN